MQMATVEDRHLSKDGDRELYERYMPLVRRIAMRVLRTLPSSVTLDDLLSVGWMGLSEALQRRTSAMNDAQFEAYASHRVRGSILDYLRLLDPLSRKLRGASRRITQATAELTNRLGRVPEAEEIAGEMGLPLEELHLLLGEIAESGFARLEISELAEFTPDHDSPETMVVQRELTELVTAAIDALPERLRIVLGLHYQEDCTFREIGEVLGVSESRACQLHSEAVHRIRARLHGRPAPGSA
jgi:RNA polymerase sigma factor FliA